jgi:hypothetical protein
VAGDMRGPSGQGADNGAWSMELRRAARARSTTSLDGEESVRERELGEGEKEELGAFIERERESRGEKWSAFNAALSERNGGGREGNDGDFRLGGEADVRCAGARADGP